jgi:hypothetical protein
MKACLAAAVLGSIVISPAMAGAPAPAAAPTVHRVFDIMRSGSKIGTDTFDISRQGDVTNVKIVTHVLVKIMFVNAYRYDHSESGTWKGSQLVSFNSTTDDNGTNHEIAATQAGAKVALDVDGTKTELPKGIVPASLFSADVSNKSQLFDPGNGKRLSTKPKDLGEETVAVHGAPQTLRHLKLSGEFDRDLWFDKDGLVKMTLLGSDKSVITSELRVSTASR